MKTNAHPPVNPAPAVNYDRDGTPYPTNLAPHLAAAELPEAEFEQFLADLRRRYALRRVRRVLETA